MTVVTNALSTYIALLDAPGDLRPPLLVNGGKRSYLKIAEDYLQVNAPNGLFSATTNYARVLRIPSDARVVKLEIFSDVPLDTNATSTLAFDIGVAFSDSFNPDSTPTLYAGQIPTTVGQPGSLTPGTLTTFAAYAS